MSSGHGEGDGRTVDSSGEGLAGKTLQAQPQQGKGEAGEASGSRRCWKNPPAEGLRGEVRRNGRGRRRRTLLEPGEEGQGGWTQRMGFLLNGDVVIYLCCLPSHAPPPPFPKAAAEHHLPSLGQFCQDFVGVLLGFCR